MTRYLDTTVPKGWQPVRDFTLHASHVGKQRTQRYQIGTTSLFAYRTKQGWKLAVALDVVNSHQFRWQQSWCARHGMLDLLWPTRNGLLQDVLRSHHIEPLQGVPISPLRLQRRQAGQYCIPHTDIVIRRHHEHAGWVIGRVSCIHQRRIRRLAMVTSVMRDNCATCVCAGCYDQPVVDMSSSNPIPSHD
jgi:hypothetical protein